jgi:hypothetical protein
VNEKNYSCPFCPQTSSRKWNLEVHLVRKHHALGEAIKITSSTQTNSRFSRRAIDENIVGNHAINTPHEQYRPSFFIRGLNGENNNPLDMTIEWLGKMSEYCRLVPRPRPDSFNWSSPVMNMFPSQFSQGFLYQLGSMEFTAKTEPIRHMIVGYESYICDRCLVNAPLSFCGMSGADEVARSYHRCNQKRMREIEGLSKQDRDSERFQLYISRPEEIHKAIKELWTEGKSPYLIAVKLSSIPRNSYDFTSLLGQGYKWLHRAIQGKSIPLDESQLKEFLFQTNGNTYVSFSIAIKQGNSDMIESYFMTLSKERSLPFPFYVENPPIPPLRLNASLTLTPWKEKT